MVIPEAEDTPGWAKLTALKNTICTCFSTTSSIMPTIAEIKDPMLNVYDEGVLLHPITLT